MSRFPTSSQVAIRAKAKIASSVPALALYAAMIGLVMAGAQSALATNVRNSDRVAESAAPKFDAACAKADLELLATIEKYEDGVLNASPTLMDAAILLQFARTTCANGDVDTARTIYESAIHQLDVAAGEDSAASIARVGK